MTEILDVGSSLSSRRLNDHSNVMAIVNKYFNHLLFRVLWMLLALMNAF